MSRKNRRAAVRMARSPPGKPLDSLYNPCPAFGYWCLAVYCPIPDTHQVGDCPWYQRRHEKIMKPLILDFETRSRIDLTQQGTTVYARDPSTEALCLGYQFNDATYVADLLRRPRMPPRVQDGLD